MKGSKPHLSKSLEPYSILYGKRFTANGVVGNFVRWKNATWIKKIAPNAKFFDAWKLFRAE
jgi:hypothetical protein